MVTKYLLKDKCYDTMYECNSLSNLPLTIWCLNALVYIISGVVCKPKLTYFVVSFYYFFFFLTECFALVLFLLSSFVLCGITSLHELHLKEPMKVR
uniref:Uncharacterized protein n=1 Tax=Piliocolobus tephrosceles TaxID=591936 RepID=A0A8C9I9K1_9PRIM